MLFHTSATEGADHAAARIAQAFASTLIVTAVMLALTLGWSLLIAHNLSRAEKAVAEEYAPEDSLALGADFSQYKSYFRDLYPKWPSEITQHNLWTEYRKRPLYGPISASLNMTLNGLFRVRYPEN